MSAYVPAERLARSVRVPMVGGLLGVAACGAAMAASAGAIWLMGMASLLLPLYVAMAIGACVYPQRFAFVLLACCIVLEGDAIDYTKPLALALYQMPPGFDHFFGFTAVPIELFTALTAISLAVRPAESAAGRPRLPVLIWAVPIVVAMGVAYGVRNGAPTNLAYIEARGILFSSAAFFIAWRLVPFRGEQLKWTVLGSSAVLASILLMRYLLFTRGGNAGVPIEFAYAHEDAVFLGIGLIVGCVFLIGEKRDWARLALLGHNALVLAAMMATGRRSATLVLIVGALTLLVLLLPRRPVLTLAVAIPALVVTSLYLATYWDSEYGAISQPARAVRSQIDPTPRDQSSDNYRELEKANVLDTIQLNKVFGVGFGRTFGQFRPLPDLTAWWPLQQFTPHQNILWLWLKMGILGAGVFLGVWVLAFKRCLVALWSVPRRSDVPVLPVVLACSLLMYLAYARIDISLAGGRSLAPLAVIVALALSLRDGVDTAP